MQRALGSRKLLAQILSTSSSGTQGVRHGAHPPVMHLRSINPHVSAAATDWRIRRALAPSIPRQRGPGTTALVAGALVGTSSFGISGVNGHLMIAASRQRVVQDVMAARWESAANMMHVGALAGASDDVLWCNQRATLRMHCKWLNLPKLRVAACRSSSKGTARIFRPSADPEMFLQALVAQSCVRGATPLQHPPGRRTGCWGSRRHLCHPALQLESGPLMAHAGMPVKQRILGQIAPMAGKQPRWVSILSLDSAVTR